MLRPRLSSRPPGLPFTENHPCEGVSRWSLVSFRQVCTPSCGCHVPCIFGDAWPMLLSPSNNYKGALAHVHGGNAIVDGAGSAVTATCKIQTHTISPHILNYDYYTSSYSRVKGRTHTVDKRLNMHPHKPHATSQPSRFSHTPRPRTHSPRNQHSH